MLVVFRGLPGTGKTFLARRLAASMPALHVLSRDRLRAGLIAHPTYSPEEKDLVDDLIVSMAGFLMERGKDILIDGMALSSARRVGQFVHAASSRGVPWRIITCVCSQETALARISRDAGAHPAGDRGESLYIEVKARFEPIPHEFLPVDTEGDTRGDADRNLQAILRYLHDPPML
jgi:predicted kinase